MGGSYLIRPHGRSALKKKLIENDKVLAGLPSVCGSLTRGYSCVSVCLLLDVLANIRIPWIGVQLYRGDTVTVWKFDWRGSLIIHVYLVCMQHTHTHWYLGDDRYL